MGRRQEAAAGLYPVYPLVRELWASLTDTPRHLKATGKHSITKINLHIVAILITMFSPTARGTLFDSGIKRSGQAVLAGS